MRGAHLTLTTVGVIVGAFACSRPPPAPASADPDPLAPLRAFESSRREQARFLEAPPSDAAFGPDPYDLVALGPVSDPSRGPAARRRTGGLAGILRGADALVLLDAGLAEKARVKTPRAPSAVASYDGPPRGALQPSDVLVASEVEPYLAHYRVAADGRSAERLPDIALGVRAVRDVAVGPEGAIHVVEEHDDRLVTLVPRADGSMERHERVLPRGPFRLVRTADTVFVASLIDHAIVAMPVDPHGVPAEPTARATLDGPFWGFDALALEGGTLVLAGGAEDHPLDRRGGSFGFVDSFAYAYFLPRGGAELVRVASVDTSDRGVIVPKAIAFDRRAPTPTALLAGYGSTPLLKFTWEAGPRAAPTVAASPGLPGVSALVVTPEGIDGASPLLDVWVRFGVAGATAVRVPASEGAQDRRGDREKLGEALFFTDLMAPANRSDGELSRFTCETCHFEGYVDGRTHHTGRGDVRATTKPLLGLFNNRPHFSRALDPDLSSVAENEFRVAGARSETDPHFTVDVGKTPWLADLRLEHSRFDAEEQRRAFMAFAMAWTHRANPAVEGRRAFSTEERAGAAVFRDRCEGCHQARAAADEPSSRVPFERWEALVMSPAGPLVWASEAYEKTGVVPYVHERGARVPSLRRLYKKRPYFTNGSAKDLGAVLTRARFGPPGFAHDGRAEGEALDAASARALTAFLDLL